MEIDKSSPILFIDASYYVFYRFYATLRWYGFRHANDDEDESLKVLQNVTEKSDFIEAFVKHITQDIKKWRNEWKIKNGNIFFCFDCSRQDIWRNKYHDNYKGTRVHANTFDGNIFPQFYEWFDKNHKNFGIEPLSVNNLEADDVVYLSVQKVLSLDDEISVIIITNDNDYLQMRNERIKIVNAQGHDLVKRSIGTPEQDLIYKIILGDVSDNIPSICKRMGHVTAKRLALSTKEERDQWITKKGKECEEAYKYNERLISFQHIPEEYCEIWRNKYEWKCI